MACNLIYSAFNASDCCKTWCLCFAEEKYTIWDTLRSLSSQIEPFKSILILFIGYKWRKIFSTLFSINRFMVHLLFYFYFFFALFLFVFRFFCSFTLGLDRCNKALHRNFVSERRTKRNDILESSSNTIMALET